MRNTHTSDFQIMLMRVAPCAVLCLAFTSQPAHAISFSFAGYTWDQDNTPDIGTLLGNSQTIGGTTFSPQLPNTTVGDVGFPDVPAGAANHAGSPFITDLTIARLVNAAITPDTSRALNLPRGNNGTSIRHGVNLGWTAGRTFANGNGNDFVLYESASSSTGPENPMVRVRLAESGAFSDWYYFAPDAFQFYVGDNANGAFATGIDLSAMGLGLGDEINLIQVANLIDADRIDGSVTHSAGPLSFGEGRVVFDGSSTVKPDAGSFAPFRDTGFVGGADGSLDPDPIYVGILGSEVPEPGAVALGIVGLFACAGVAPCRRRKNALSLIVH